MGTRYYWVSGATNFGLASSWTPSGGPPTASDTANINVAASISGTGTAEILNIDSTAVTVSGPLTTTVAQTRIGTTAAGSVAVGSEWNLENGALTIGADYAGALTIGTGGDVTNVFGLNLGSVAGAQGTLVIENGGQLSDNANDSTKWDLIGYAAGSSGAVTVEGDGSNWTSTGQINVGYLGQGSLTVSDGGSVDALNLIIGNNSSGPVSGGGSGTALIESGGSVTTTGPWDEIGAFQGATGAVTVTGAGSTWASGGAIQIGVGGNGSLTVSDGASVTAVDGFEVGQQDGSSTNDGSSGALLIESGGTAVTGGHANDGSSYDTVGLNAAGPASTATVTGAGSSWTMNANLVIDTTGAVLAADGGTITIADDINMNPGSLLSVDSTSAITDDGSAAEAGYLTLGPDSEGRATLSGNGTVDANIIDNGIVFATQGTLTLNGSISGSYKLKLGADATLALNGGPVSNALGVYFLGWYGDLEIGDATGFSDSINDFVAGDIIDLTNVKFTSSSYTYTPSSVRGGPADLQIVEDGATYNLNVDSDDVFSGDGLTVTADASGKGTEIVFASTPASPFNLWGAALPNFFSTASGPVNGDDWATSNVTNDSDPIWVDTETPAGSYAPGQAGAYTIVLTTQDFLGDQQSLVTVATDANIVDPFGSSAASIGNLAGATIFSSTATTAAGALLYWRNSTTSGDYALEFQPIATTDPTGPSSGPSTVLNGSLATLLSAVADPTGWTYDSGSSASLVVSYTTAASATTEDIWFQAFANAGVATSPDVEVAANVPDSTQYFINYSGGAYSYDYASVDGAATGLYAKTFNATTGALGAATEILPLPSFSSITGVTERPALSSGGSLQFVEGVVNGQAVIQAFMNSDSTPTASFSLTSASDPFATADVEDINDDNLDDTVLVYTDDNHVHLELLNQNGVQIGSDFIVPGLTSFDQIETLTGASGTSNYPDTRVEIDYTAADPGGGTEIEGVIYDIVGAPIACTIGGTDSNLGNGGNGEYSGTPFNDTITDASGTYTVNGGGGDDMFIVNYDKSQVQLSENSAGDVLVTTPTGVATLELFSTIVMDNATVTISGSTLKQKNSDGTSVVSTFNVTGQPYTEMVKSIAASGNTTAVEYEGYAGEPYDAKTDFYSSSGALQDIVFNDDSTGAIGGLAYESCQTIDNASNGLLATVCHFDDGGNVYIGDASGVTSPTFEGASDSPNAPQTSFAVFGGDWTIAGGGTSESFTFAALFNEAKITDYGAAFKAGRPDVVSVSTTDFADWSAMLGDAAASGPGGVNTAFTSTATGDKLILDGVTPAELRALTAAQAAADFKFYT